jgi:SAM-dependent methyltransferase
MPAFSKDASDNADSEWQKRYLSDDIPWDKGYAAPPLAEILSRCNLTGNILVPGCGFGHDVRLIAEAGGEALGLDISPYAIDKANSYSRISEERYEVGNFFSHGEIYAGKFNWIFEHTFLCAIDPSQRRDYVRSALRLLNEKGYLAAIFYIHIDDPEGPPYPISHQEIDQLFKAHFDTLEQWVPKSAYPGREGREEIRIMRRKELQPL